MCLYYAAVGPCTTARGSGSGSTGAGSGVGGRVDREMGGSSAGTVAGGDCAAPSVADGITLNSLTADESPARFTNQPIALTGDGGDCGGTQQPYAAAGSQRDRPQPAAGSQQPGANSHREVAVRGGVLPPFSGPLRDRGADVGGGLRAANKRERAVAGASGSRRSARKHPGGGHGRERERSERGGPRVGFSTLRESTGDCGAAAPLARAGSAGGV